MVCAETCSAVYISNPALVRNSSATPGYSASKAAVIVSDISACLLVSIVGHELVTDDSAQHLTKNLAIELGPRHILTNCIAPGFFPSKMASGLIEASGGVKALGEANPNGRLGLPEDIVGAVVFLCSKASEHVNGDVLIIDGGNHLDRARI